MKRIIICADGTWNRPEGEGYKDEPTNVIKFARGIAPTDAQGIKQVVFYDWGIGSYHSKIRGGGMGSGLDKNIKDGYRFLVHNYEPGDEIYLFGFSRGAYTVRSLSGFINKCGILNTENAPNIDAAFNYYKKKSDKPSSAAAKAWRNKNSVEPKTYIHFIGVWDTVGAMGLPFSIFGLIEQKDLFYDHHIGSNIRTARHALALDEKRDDFKPTIWNPKQGVDLEQVWFAGVHSDVGGSYKPDSNGTVYSDIPMVWMQQEANAKGLIFENGFGQNPLNPLASIHNSYRRIWKVLGTSKREIPEQTEIPTKIHQSVKDRYEQSSYRSKTLDNYLTKNNGQWPEIVG